MSERHYESLVGYFLKVNCIEDESIRKHLNLLVIIEVDYANSNRRVNPTKSEDCIENESTTSLWVHRLQETSDPLSSPIRDHQNWF